MAVVTARVALEKFRGDGRFERDVARRGALVSERLERIGRLVPRGRGTRRR